MVKTELHMICTTRFRNLSLFKTTGLNIWQGFVSYYSLRGLVVRWLFLWNLRLLTFLKLKAINKKSAFGFCITVTVKRRHPQDAVRDSNMSCWNGIMAKDQGTGKLVPLFSTKGEKVLARVKKQLLPRSFPASQAGAQCQWAWTLSSAQLLRVLFNESGAESNRKHREAIQSTWNNCCLG